MLDHPSRRGFFGTLGAAVLAMLGLRPRPAPAAPLPLAPPPAPPVSSYTCTYTHGVTTTFCYDSTARLCSHFDDPAAGSVTTFTYDAFNRQTGSQGPTDV